MFRHPLRSLRLVAGLCFAAPAFAEEPAPPATPPAAPAEAPAAPAEAPATPSVVPPSPQLQTVPTTVPTVITTQETEEGALPIPTMHIDRIMPRSSYEFAVQFGYVDVGYFRQSVGLWTAFGLRGAWGHHFGPHRLGFEGVGEVEGPFGVYTTGVVEPRIAWDWVTGIDKGAQIGASLGPAIGYHSQAVVGPDNNLNAVTVSPTLAVRIGYSEGWSRVGRRFFIVAEPRLRYAPAGEGRDQPFSPGLNIAVGSGRGN